MCSAHFEAGDFFGLDKSQVVFFQQGYLPCLTEGGQIILEAPGKVGPRLCVYGVAGCICAVGAGDMHGLATLA